MKRQQKSRKQRQRSKNNPPVDQKGLINSARLGFSGSPYMKQDQLQEPQNSFLFKVNKEDTLNYVNFFDSEDSFLKLMHSTINSSPTTKSILDKKLFFTLGKGFRAVPKKKSFIQNDRPDAIIDNKEIDDLEHFFEDINGTGETINDLLSKVIYDEDGFGNLYIEIVKVEDSLKLYHRPVHEVRLKEVTDRRGLDKYCVVSRDFAGLLGSTYERKVLPLYPSFKKIDGFERCILHVKHYQPGFDYYGLPSWVSAILWAELEYRIAKYNQSEFENGFMPSALIQLFGNANDEQAQDALDMFTEEQTGTGNQAKLFAMLMQTGSEPAKIDILAKQHEGNYMELSNLAEKKIMQVHGFSDALLGNKTAGELGGSQQLRTELEYKYEEMFIPRQKRISKKILQPIIDLLAQQKNRESTLSLEFIKNIPTSYAGDIDINEVLTVDERRKELGFEPLNTATNGTIN